MNITTDWIETLSHKYNTKKSRAFASAKAKAKFLTPIGISLKGTPDDSFGNDCTTLPNELAHFEAMHFLKYKITKAYKRSAMDPGKPGSHKLTPAITRWASTLLTLRNRIVSSNMGLIYECIKITNIRMDSDILISSGHQTLLKSAECFDPWRGFKFSTYACRSILRVFAKTGRAPMPNIEETMDPPELIEKEYDQAIRIERVMHYLNDHDLISDRERETLIYRFGLNIDRSYKLKELADMQSLTKERIRQVQNIALQKIRQAVDNDPILL